LDYVIESLQHLNLPNTTPIILGCDAPTKLHTKYAQFQQNVREKYPHVQIVEASEKAGICNNVKSAMSVVQTKYVILVQHDMPFARPLEIPSALQVMERYPKVKYIRFNQNENQCRRAGCDDRDCSFYREQRFPVVEQQQTCLALIRTACWSDNNHLTTVAYYNQVVFPKCKPGDAMEKVMTPFSAANTHNITGTYIYGPLGFPWQVEHEDGSETRPANHKRRYSTDKGVDYDRSQFTQNLPLVSGPCIEGE
jgi:hypothetical protein